MNFFVVNPLLSDRCPSNGCCANGPEFFRLSLPNCEKLRLVRFTVTISFLFCSRLSLSPLSLSLSFFLHIFISSPLRSRASFLSLRATNLAFTLYYCSVELVLCPCFTCMCMCTCSSHLYMPLFYEKPTRLIFVFPYLLLLTHKVCRCGRYRFNRIPAIHISAG